VHAPRGHWRKVDHVFANLVHWSGPRYRDPVGREYLLAASAAPSVEPRSDRRTLGGPVVHPRVIRSALATDQSGVVRSLR
jgi:hypothetical protein